MPSAEAFLVIAVQVRLFASLRQHYPDPGLGQTMLVDMGAGATVGHLMNRLRLSAEKAKVAFVHGVVREEGHPLAH